MKRPRGKYIDGVMAPKTGVRTFRDKDTNNGVVGFVHKPYPLRKHHAPHLVRGAEVWVIDPLWYRGLPNRRLEPTRCRVTDRPTSYIIRVEPWDHTHRRPMTTKYFPEDAIFDTEEEARLWQAAQVDQEIAAVIERLEWLLGEKERIMRLSKTKR